MNYDLIFKVILAVLLLAIFLELVLKRNKLRVDWRTTLAGLLVIGITLFINCLYFYRVGQFQDLIQMVLFLTVGLGFLITVDGK